MFIASGVDCGRADAYICALVKVGDTTWPFGRFGLKVHSKVLASVTMALAIVLLIAAAVFTGDEACADNACAAQCYAAEKACMRATKGGSSCDGVLTRCLQGCRARR